MFIITPSAQRMAGALTHHQRLMCHIHAVMIQLLAPGAGAIPVQAGCKTDGKRPPARQGDNADRFACRAVAEGRKKTK